MTFRFCSQDERSVPTWRDRSKGAYGRGGVYASFDDLQGLRQSLVNEVRSHGRLHTSDVALYDDGASYPGNHLGPRHDYGWDERTAHRKKLRAARVAKEQRKWEQNRRQRQERKERQAAIEWRRAEEERRLQRERAKGDQAHYSSQMAELARVEVLRMQTEAERAEAETAQWVEDRTAQLRARQLAQEVLGADADRRDIDRLITLGQEMVRQANEKYLKK